VARPCCCDGRRGSGFTCFGGILDWKAVQHLFEWDVALLDVYVFNADADLWQRLLDALRTSGYGLDFHVDGDVGVLPEHAAQVFALRQEADTCLSVWAGDLRINFHFFTLEQIEFDIDPRDVNETSLSDLLVFLRYIGLHLQRRVVLTPEGAEDLTLLAYEPEGNRWEYTALSG
jgi:hypothetical protein